MYFKVNEHRVGTEFDLDFDLETNFDYEDLVDKSKCTVSLSASFFKDYETSGKNYPFEFKIILEGYFCASKSEMNVQQFHSLSEKNGVAMLFPYLRSIICDASKMANIPPVRKICGVFGVPPGYTTVRKPPMTRWSGERSTAARS